MADTGFTEVYVTDWDTLKFTWWIDEQNIATNTSSIGWKMQLIATAYGYITPLYNRYWEVTINGETFSGRTNINIGNWQTVDLASGFVDIPHNADGSKTFSYSFSQNLNIVFSDVPINTIYGNGTGAINDIPRAATFTEVPATFNDESNPTVKYSNPAGSVVTQLQVCIANETGGTIYVPYKNATITGTSYTFSLTDAERKTLRQAATKNSLPVRFYIKTTLGGVDYRNSLPSTMSIINATPTLSPTYANTHARTLQITGDSTGKTAIKGLNTISYSFGAAARKEATITTYKVTCGSITSYDASGTLENIESPTITFYVEDSRGNKLQKDYPLTLIDYVNLTCNQNVKIELVGETSAQVDLAIQGNYFNGSFGSTSNSLKLEVRYTQSNGSMGSWVNLTSSKAPTFNGHSYTFETTITGFDYNQSYTFQCRATDALGDISTGEYTVRLKPAFDWSDEDFNVNVPLHMNGTMTLRATDTNRLVVSANGGDVYIRPNGSTTDAGQLRVMTDGRLSLDGTIMADFIVEQNIINYKNRTIFYRKWKSGLVEVDCNVFGIATADLADTIYLPFFFKEEPMVMVGIQQEMEWTYSYESAYHDNGDAIEFFCYGPTFTDDTYYFYTSVRIIGKI